MSVLTKRWKVIEAGGKYGEEKWERTEDMSIFTEDNEEVVGCSEWMRADRETFDHIVKLHNDSL